MLRRSSTRSQITAGRLTRSVGAPQLSRHAVYPTTCFPLNLNQTFSKDDRVAINVRQRRRKDLS